MTQGERIKKIRKTLNMTMEKFGEKLGVGKTTISNIENDNRSVTEQMAKSICREYSVNYTWLRTGEGEMFVDSDEDIIEAIDRIMAGENEFHKNLFKMLTKLDDNDLISLENMINKFKKVSEENETDS